MDLQVRKLLVAENYALTFKFNEFMHIYIYPLVLPLYN